MRAVNLIPTDARRRGLSTSTGLPFFGVVAGLAVVLLAVVLLVSAHSRVNSQEAQLRSTRAATVRWTTVAGSYDHDVAVGQQYSSTIQNVETLAAQRYQWSDLLGQLAAAVPKSTLLSSLSSSATASAAPATSSSTSTGSSSAPSQITLAACTFSQSTVAQTMENLRRIHGVSGVTLSSSTETADPSNACPRRPVTFGVTLSFATPASASSTSTASAPATPTTTTSSAGAS
jgi:Tfp pilus assembly protein PilN